MPGISLKPKATVPYGEKAALAEAHANALLDARRRMYASTPQGRVAHERAVRYHTALGAKGLKLANQSVQVPPKVRMAFNAFDRNNTGKLDYRALRQALKMYGLDPSAREAARILAAYDDHPDGRLDVTEFYRLAQDLTQGVVRAAAAPTYDYEQLPARVRETFAEFDTNRSGFLDYREVRQALRAYGLDTTKTGAARVLAAYDRKPDGKLDIAEFARIVHDLDRGQIRSVREVVPERAQRIFRTYDLDRDGRLSVHELRLALRELGFNPSSDEAGRVLQRYEENTPGKQLDIVEFSNLLQDLELGVLRAPTPHPSLRPRRPLETRPQQRLRPRLRRLWIVRRLRPPPPPSCPLAGGPRRQGCGGTCR